MQADLAVGQPVRLERRPGTVVGRLTASRAVRSGTLWGLIFGVAIASSEISYTTIYKTQAERDALAAAYGSNKATSALFGPAPQLQTVAGFTVFKISMTLMILGAVWGLLLSTKLLRGEEDDGRWDLLLSGQTTRSGAATQALAGLGAGLFMLWAVTAVITVLSGRSSSVDIAAGPSLYFALAMVAAACMFLAVGALTSQLAATRRQAASFAAAFLGVAYAVRMIADAGVGLYWLIWMSPLGWVEELRPLTAPQPLALVPIIVFTVILAVAAARLAGDPRRGREHRAGPVALRAAPPTALRTDGSRHPLDEGHGHRMGRCDRRLRVALRSDREVRRFDDLGILGPGGVLQAWRHGDRCGRGAGCVLPDAGGAGRLRGGGPGHHDSLGGVGRKPRPYPHSTRRSLIVARGKALRRSGRPRVEWRRRRGLRLAGGGQPEHGSALHDVDRSRA